MACFLLKHLFERRIFTKTPVLREILTEEQKTSSLFFAKNEKIIV
jgi:hypothetical protein